MQKPAPVESPILPAIQNRWSPVIFDPKEVEKEKVKQMFEAARWAPSSYNEQPWMYVYTQKSDGKKREDMEGLLVEGNGWAKNSGMLIVAFAKTSFSKNEKPNYNAEYDTGCATGYLFLQLESLGLVGHEMVGFAVDKANNVLNVPETYKPMAMMAVGYPGNPADAANELKERDSAPRVRKSVSEFVFRGKAQ